jgi:hypothetical protein
MLFDSLVYIFLFMHASSRDMAHITLRPYRNKNREVHAFLNTAVHTQRQTYRDDTEVHTQRHTQRQTHKH